MNRITIIPHLEIAGIFEAKAENAIATTVTEALQNRHSKYNDIHDSILHFILIGHEFYDERDDAPIEHNVIQGFELAGVKSALLTIFAMSRREIITHRACQNFYSAKEDFGKLTINDELDRFTERLLKNEYITNEPRIFTLLTTKMTKQEKTLVRIQNLNFVFKISIDKGTLMRNFDLFTCETLKK